MKYLELEFFVDDQPVPKDMPIYAIMKKFSREKPGWGFGFAQSQPELTIHFRLRKKEQHKKAKKKYKKNVNSLAAKPSDIINNLIQSIRDIRTTVVDEHIKDIICLFKVIHELTRMRQLFTAQTSPLFEILQPLKQNKSIAPLYKKFVGDTQHMFDEQEENLFLNQKIS